MRYDLYILVNGGKHYQYMSRQDSMASAVELMEHLFIEFGYVSWLTSRVEDNARDGQFILPIDSDLLFHAGIKIHKIVATPALMAKKLSS